MRLLSAALLLAAVTAAAAQEPPKSDDPKKEPPKTIKAPDGWVFHTNKDGLTTYLLPKSRKGSSSSEGSISKDGLTGKTQVTNFELADGRELTVVIVKLGGPKLKELKVADVHDMAYEADQEPGAKLSEPADFKINERLSGKEYYVTKRDGAMRVVAVVTRDARMVKLVVSGPNKKATQDDTADTFLHSLILRNPKPKEPAKGDEGKKKDG